jgi:hypothetical protein
MALFTDDDMTQLREVAMLPFQDAYVITRKAPTAVRDPMNNRMDATSEDYTVVETGLGRIRREGLQPTERIMADRLGWSASYSVDVPIDTLAHPDDRVMVGNRTFDIEGVMREGTLGLITTLVCHERSH